MEEGVILHLRNVVRDFDSLSVLRGVDLDMRAGESFALMGPSGAGKSTLLRVVAGLDREHGGRVERAARVAMMFGEPRLLPWRSALENVRLATGTNAENARRLLTLVGLETRTGAFPSTLSLGQQRRVALARVLALDAGLLLLDEPFASLDERTAQDLRILLRDIMKRTRACVLMATHNPNDARLCDRVGELHEGRLRKLTPGEIEARAPTRVVPRDP